MKTKPLYMFIHLCAFHDVDELAEKYAERGAAVALNEGRRQSCAQFWSDHYYSETMRPLHDYYRDDTFEGFSRGVKRFAALHFHRGWIAARNGRKA